MAFTLRAPARPTAPSPSIPSAPSRRRDGIALAVIVTCQLMVVLDATVVNIALTRIQPSLHFTPAGLSWVIDAYTLTFGGLMLLGGRAGDIFGRRRMLVARPGRVHRSPRSSAAWPRRRRCCSPPGPSRASVRRWRPPAPWRSSPPRSRRVRPATGPSACSPPSSAGGGSLGLILGGALTSWVVVAVGAVHQRAHRAGHHRPRAPVHRRAAPPGRSPRPSRGAAVHRRAGLADLRLHPGRGPRRPAPRSTAVAVRGRRGAAGHLRGRRGPERRPRWCPCTWSPNRTRGLAYLVMLLRPGGHVRDVLLHQPVRRDRAWATARCSTGLAFLPLTGAIFTFSRVMPRVLGRIGPRPLLVHRRWSSSPPAWPGCRRPRSPAGYLAGLFGPLLLFGLGAGTVLPAAQRHHPHRAWPATTRGRHRACCRPCSRSADRSAWPCWSAWPPATARARPWRSRPPSPPWPWSWRWWRPPAGAPVTVPAPALAE